ncbi:MAG: nuclear transport factor 2 family protein [Novosphingobium sp.]|nr:nuclear transport factor 2 family protein [Novosphingobium sp.]
MAFTGAMADRLAIRELYDTYADGGSRCCRETWLGCYADDARWRSHYFDLQGIEAIAATFDRIMQGVAHAKVFTQIGSIEIEGDAAQVRMRQDECLFYEDGQTYELLGTYDDVLVRRDGRWRFKDRVYTVIREVQPQKKV